MAWKEASLSLLGGCRGTHYSLQNLEAPLRFGSPAIALTHTCAASKRNFDMQYSLGWKLPYKQLRWCHSYSRLVNCAWPANDVVYQLSHLLMLQLSEPLNMQSHFILHGSIISPVSFLTLTAINRPFQYSCSILNAGHGDCACKESPQ